MPFDFLAFSIRCHQKDKQMKIGELRIADLPMSRLELPAKFDQQRRKLIQTDAVTAGENEYPPL